MILQNKIAVIYGGGVAIGGAVARAFASAGARIYLAGRTEERLKAVANLTLLGRLPTLAQVAETAVFMASDRAAAITGTVIDLTCGAAVRTNEKAMVGALD